ncbi:NAD-dependent protein deacetylase Sirt6 [Anthonomus grandis grandis]|uniref:NAD-dependent protein deacetylase Sirt6 n=1 Tax=Anthonomus grandis grandis TaxID=2921223 RepID=UPI00216549F4|nr:NAD-dependent protein deacetylase Sirt6 [Anthonomus grandis grandis]
MSCSYADGLSEYDDKGVLGVPEKFDSEDDVYEKSLLLTTWIQEAKHVVVHTGAGISTSAGIPDFRGPNGVWTLEKEGKKPDINISFNEAVPTKTHMALKYLIEKNYVHYIVSQNIDGLHLRTGVSRTHLSELHGNMFIGQCDICESQFVRHTATSTVGQKYLGEGCRRDVRGRTCRGKLKDTILDWEDGLPERDLDMSNFHSSLADLNICLGTTLQIVPSGNLPLRCQKFGGKVVIVNLQPTKHDKKADLIINYYVDEVFEQIMRHLCLEIPEYSPDLDPTKNQVPYACISWDISKEQLLKWKKLYEERVKHFRENKKPANCKQTKRKVKKEAKNDDKKIKFNGDSFQIGTTTIIRRKRVEEKKLCIDLTLLDSDNEIVE